MTDYVITPPSRPSLRVHDSTQRFPIRRVFCVGRNYEAHIRELGNDTRELPVFFMKPADAVFDPAQIMPFPKATDDLHHEVELVVALGQGGSHLSPDEALKTVWGASVGIDLTRRDVQAVAKSKGLPWDMAKGFDDSAPIAQLVKLQDVKSLTNGSIWLNVNGDVRQSGDLAEMIWPVADCIAHLSNLVELAAGDLIMTGTPAGVSQLKPGDVVTAGVDGLPSLTLRVAT